MKKLSGLKVQASSLKCPNCGSKNIEYAGSSNAGVAICKDCRALVAKFP